MKLGIVGGICLSSIASWVIKNTRSDGTRLEAIHAVLYCSTSSDIYTYYHLFMFLSSIISFFFLQYLTRNSLRISKIIRYPIHFAPAQLLALNFFSSFFIYFYYPLNMNSVVLHVTIPIVFFKPWLWLSGAPLSLLGNRVP